MSTFQLAWRNIWRSPRRTALTATAIAVALALFVLMLAWVQGFIDYALESTTRSWSGMAQIRSPEFIATEESSHVLPDGPALLERVRAADHVSTATPRVYGEALAAMGDRTAAVQLVGIDFESERAATSFNEKLSAGDWPREKNQVLIGVKLAEDLELDVGDKLALTAADVHSGALNDHLVRISGLLYTSNNFLDQQAVIGGLAVMQGLLGLEDDLHEIALQLDVPIADQAAIERTIAPFAGEGVSARAWQVVQKDLASTLDLQRRILWIAVLIVFLIASFGVINTMTMSFLERFREFGILRAIGTSPGRIFALIVAEAGWIGVLGVALGMLLSVLFYWPLSTYGLNIGGAEAYGVSFDREILFRMDAMQTVWLVVVFVALTVATGMLTARRAALISPTEALREG